MFSPPLPRRGYASRRSQFREYDPKLMSRDIFSLEGRSLMVPSPQGVQTEKSIPHFHDHYISLPFFKKGRETKTASFAFIPTESPSLLTSPSPGGRSPPVQSSTFRRSCHITPIYTPWCHHKNGLSFAQHFSINLLLSQQLIETFNVLKIA